MTENKRLLNNDELAEVYFDNDTVLDHIPENKERWLGVVKERRKNVDFLLKAQDEKTARLILGDDYIPIVRKEIRKETRQATLKEIEAFKFYHYAQDPYGQRKEDSYSIVISDKQWEKLKGGD